MDAEKSRTVDELVANLQLARTLRETAGASAAEASARMRLREWQAARLALSYSDLLVAEKTMNAAAFFLSDLYGPKDFSARDADIARLVPLMAKTLTLSGLQTVSRAVELDALSERLDAQMVTELRKSTIRAIDGASYADVYRRVGDRPARERQIELIGDIGYALERLTRQRFIRGALRIMREPAHMAGLGAIQEFLEHGFNAFYRMGDAKEFLETIRIRETRLLQQLFAGACPAELDDVIPLKLITR